LVAVTDPAMRRICQETLAHAGFALGNDVNTGAAAVATIREQHPAIILLSQQLDDVPAEEAVKWMRSNPESASTPIIVLGGAAGARVAAAGVTALPRSVSAAQLRDALAQALGAKTKTRRMRRAFRPGVA